MPTKIKKRCLQYDCRKHHALHLQGDDFVAWSAVLVGGSQPYLNIHTASDVIVASIAGNKNLAALADAINKCLKRPAK